MNQASRVTVEHDGVALATFYMKPEPWVEDAACLGTDPNVFFDNIDLAHGAQREEAIATAQGICANCPVRTQCGERAMYEEQGADEAHRHGFRAYMTAAQRVSVHRRGGLLGRDPMKMVQGKDGKRKVPPVPLEGDKWTRHHTTLARKVVRWVVENIEIGEVLPTQATICKTLSCQPQPLRRVMDALVQDGTLDFKGIAPGRGRNSTTTKYIRRGAPRMVSSDWLPQHLRDNN